MKSVRVDTTGELRCWNCGGASFREKRTVRSKMMVGVGSLATKKKMKCHLCDEFNDVGSAKPYKGPASKRRGKKLGTFTNMHGQVVTEPAIRVEVINQAIPQGTLQAIQPTPQPIRALSAPAGWLADPTSRHELRYWTGTAWSEHVSDMGATDVDPV